MTNLIWRRSSYSAGQGNCVEVAWRKATASAESGNCVEVALTPAALLVRDSKNPTGPSLALPTPHWRRFVDSLNH